MASVPAVGPPTGRDDDHRVVLPPIPVIAIGDSVMLGAAPKLSEALGEGTYVDAKVSMSAGHDSCRLRTRAGWDRASCCTSATTGRCRPRPSGPSWTSSSTCRGWWWSTCVTRPWEPDVNRVLAEQVPTYPNARLLDWWGESAMHGDWFAKDKTHLNAAGANSMPARRCGARGCRHGSQCRRPRSPRPWPPRRHSPANGRHDRPTTAAATAPGG